MPRLPRIDFPGLFHHVIARGIMRGEIFRTDNDRAHFVHRLGKILEETKTFCYSWALMPNHIHLLLQTGSTAIGKVMQRLLTGHAVTFNQIHKRVGHLFQNRYKDIICQEDPYFMELIRYIPLNPARAGIIQTPEELATYPWTSYSTVMGKVHHPWLMTSSILERFSPDDQTARARYETFLKDGWNQKKRKDLEGEGSFKSTKQFADLKFHDQRILGDDEFVLETLRQSEQLETNQRLLKEVSLEALIDVVADLAGLMPGQLTQKGRVEAVSAAKAMIIYAGVAWLGHNMARMAELVGLSPSAASRAYVRGEGLSKDVQLFERLMQLCTYVP